MDIAVSPATFKQELDPSKDNATGKILASRYVKAGIDPGQIDRGPERRGGKRQKGCAR